ncbi:Sec-independent protein translocase protein TatB [Chloroflexota bacterium]
MGFFDVGILEILFILVVALIVWGPGKLPEIARTLGRMTRVLRKASSDLTAQVTKELEVEEKDRPPQSRVDSNNETQKLDADKPKSGDTQTALPRD